MSMSLSVNGGGFKIYTIWVLLVSFNFSLKRLDLIYSWRCLNWASVELLILSPALNQESFLSTKFLHSESDEIASEIPLDARFDIIPSLELDNILNWECRHFFSLSSPLSWRDSEQYRSNQWFIVGMKPKTRHSIKTYDKISDETHKTWDQTQDKLWDQT